MTRRKSFNLTSEQVNEIVRRYPDEKSATIAADFNIYTELVYKTARRYGVKKSEEFRQSEHSGRIQKGKCLSPETQFTKGCTGNTIEVRMQALIKKRDKLEAWKRNLWKKGNKPYNTAYDGEIRFRPGYGYWFIRISEQNWVYYHRYLWEQNYGEIPKGWNVVYKNGVNMKVPPELKDIECISDAELGDRNRITKYPAELQNAIKTKNILNKIIKEYGHKNN